MKLFYVVKHRLAEYAFTGRGLFALLIALILFSTLFLTLYYGLSVETVFLPQSSYQGYRQIRFFNCRGAMNSTDEVHELLDLCNSFGRVECFSFLERSSYSQAEPIDEQGYEISGSGREVYADEAYFKYGRTFFEEAEYINADDICIILSRKVQFETGDRIHDETGQYTVIGTIKPLEPATGKEFAYTVILPYTTYLNRVGLPGYISLIYENQIGLENESGLIDYIKTRWPKLEIAPTAQYTIPQNKTLETSIVFAVIFITLIAVSMAVNYFDQKNISNDSVLRLVGAERAEIVIYSFITRVLVVMLPAVAALLLHWLFVTKMRGTIAFADKILRYKTGDYLTIAAMLFVSACLTLLPYTIKVYARSAREFAAKRE